VLCFCISIFLKPKPLKEVAKWFYFFYYAASNFILPSVAGV
jgi:hypothetical protein